MPPKPTPDAVPAPAAAPAAFETQMKRLETVVAQLERTDLSLDDSVKLFEEGMGLVQECRQQLEAAEGRIEILVRRSGAMMAEPFTPKDE
ncbi:MAG TPA: exodeoxyribonuclease VII small subunit [Terriglobales bacterium]|nr:exodeoxyribonuclease VII small subunit [Terriglobales bacterium]